MRPGFIHLRLHSEFSIEDSVVRLPGLVDAVSAAAMPAVALTDANNMFGLVKYYTEHWDETEAERTVLYYGDEETKAELASNARNANAEREQNYREEQSSSSSSSDSVSSFFFSLFLT